MSAKQELEHVHIIRLRWCSQLKSSIGQYGYNATTHLLTCQLISHFHCLSCESPPGTAGCCISPLTSKQITCLSWLAYCSRTISDQRSGSWKVEGVGSLRQQNQIAPSLKVLTLGRFYIFTWRKKTEVQFRHSEFRMAGWGMSNCILMQIDRCLKAFRDQRGNCNSSAVRFEKAEMSEFLQNFGSPLWIKRLHYCCGPLLCIRNHPFFCFFVRPWELWVRTECWSSSSISIVVWYLMPLPCWIQNLGPWFHGCVGFEFPPWTRWVKETLNLLMIPHEIIHFQWILGWRQNRLFSLRRCCIEWRALPLPKIGQCQNSYKSLLRWFSWPRVSGIVGVIPKLDPCKSELLSLCHWKIC